MKNKIKLVRFQFELGPQRVRDFENIQREMEARTRMDVFDAALNLLNLLKWAARCRAEGRRIGSEGADGRFRELEIL